MIYLTELDLTENPISDKRLLKLIQQCRTKQIIDYVKQHGAEMVAIKGKGSSSGQMNKKKTSKNTRDSSSAPQHKLHVQRLNDDTLKVSNIFRYFK